MEEVEKRIKEIKEELNAFDDEFLKYAFIVELSSYVEANQPDLMKDDYLYRGCQSQVWVKYQIKNNIFTMKATSDTLIIRGVLYIMMQLYNGLDINEIVHRKINFLEECGIVQHFSSTRIAGIGGIIISIYDFCYNFLKTNEKV